MTLPRSFHHLNLSRRYHGTVKEVRYISSASYCPVSVLLKATLAIDEGVGDQPLFPAGMEFELALFEPPKSNSLTINTWLACQYTGGHGNEWCRRNGVD